MVKYLGFCSLIMVHFLLAGSCNTLVQLSAADIKEVAVSDFQEKGYKIVQDTQAIGVKRIRTSATDEWYVAYNRVMCQPALFLYHVTDPKETPHFIPLGNKSDAIIEHVDFENVTNDDDYELVVDLHFDYGLAYQGREIIILRHPFQIPAYEIFSFPFEQVWERIDTFDQKYGLPKHSKRIENHCTYEFFEGYILIKGTINYRENHLLEYKWEPRRENFILVLDEELHEIDEEENKGGVTHKLRGNKKLIKVNAHEEGCAAHLLEDAQGHVVDIPKDIHDALLCSPVTALSSNGRFLIYTHLDKNRLYLYDIEQQRAQTLLDDFKSYEGVSEITWTKGKPLRFAFVSVNQEELLENTKVYIFTIQDGQAQGKRYPVKVHYECDLDGLCVPIKDYHYKFQTYDLFVYATSASGNFKAIRL